MTRVFALLSLLTLFLAPLAGAEEPGGNGLSGPTAEALDAPASEPEPKTQADIAAQNLAIAISVQEQLLSCWRLPSGYAGHLISVRLAFLGDGQLDGEPGIEPDSLRTAGQYPELIRSIAAAIERCLPFAGLEQLGAGPAERFDITVHFQS